MFKCGPAELVLPVDECHGAMAAEPLDGLWVGFMNGVPVLGTDRNIVDGFIALIQGDHQTAEETGFKDVLDGRPCLRHWLLLRELGTLIVSGNASDTVMKMVQNFAYQSSASSGQGSGKNTKNTSKQKTADQVEGTLIKGFEKLREELTRRGENVERDEEQTKRSKRGEHVFNNSLLKLYRSIIEEFIEAITKGTSTSVQTVVDLTGPNSMVNEAYSAFQPGRRINMSEGHRNNVRTWVAHFPNSPEFIYIPANNNLYAFMTSWLKKEVVAYMLKIYHGCNDSSFLRGLRDRIGRIAELMRQFRVYLDPEAAFQWLCSNSGNIKTFRATEEAVQEMLRHLDPNREYDIRQWVEEIRAALSRRQ